MAELLQTLSYASFIAAVPFVALAVVLFFVFDIRAVIGELTGKTATAEIARIREQGVTRQYKGRTLQSIVLDEQGVSTDFSLDKLKLGAESTDAAAETSEALTTFLDTSQTETSEALTTLLDSSQAETSEAFTTLLDTSQTETSEALTTFLDSSKPESSEQ